MRSSFSSSNLQQKVKNGLLDVTEANNFPSTFRRWPTLKCHSEWTVITLELDNVRVTRWRQKTIFPGRASPPTYQFQKFVVNWWPKLIFQLISKIGIPNRSGRWPRDYVHNTWRAKIYIDKIGILFNSLHIISDNFYFISP